MIDLSVSLIDGEPPSVSLSDSAPIEQNCTICLLSMNGEDRHILSHPIGNLFHYFHATCIQHWLQTRQTCPICRAKITSINGIGLAPIADPITLGGIAWNPEIAAREAEELAFIANENDEGSHFDLDAAVDAAVDGNLDLVRAFLANRSTIAQKLEIMAAFAGHLNRLEVLLANGLISEEGRGDAVLIVTDSGLPQSLLQELLANGPISEHHRFLALCHAATQANRDNSLAMVRSLLAIRPISEHNQAEVIRVARDNSLAMVRSLLAIRPISEHDQAEVILVAAASDRRDIVDFFRETNSSTIRLVDRF